MSDEKKPSVPAEPSTLTSQAAPAVEDAINLPHVYVFGAGIAGLTAAHELVERGFAVTVVEPAPDVDKHDKQTFTCAVGGVAKTQWAQFDDADRLLLAAREKCEKREMIRADPYLPEISLQFDAAGNIFPSDELRLKRFVGLLREFDKQPELKLESYGSSQQSADDMANRVRDFIQNECPHANFGKNTPFSDTTKQLTVDIKFANDRAISPGERFIFPGEHGFRFFPSFYHHVFETMKRTPYSSELRPSADSFRSVYDNLIPTENSFIALGSAKRPAPERAIEFPRQRTVSPATLMTRLKEYLSALGYTAEDVAHLSLKIFKYMTSCSKRRAMEYEEISWWDFIEGDRLSEVCRDHMDKAPEVLGAMVAKKSDARTQGNCVVQLLLDPVLRPDRVDSTLNGPTSTAWFEPWHRYLHGTQRVTFIQGSLTGFTYAEGRGIVPVAKHAYSNVDVLIEENSFFVIAVSLPVMLGTAGTGDGGLAKSFLDVYDANKEKIAKSCGGSIGDFEKLLTLAKEAKDWNDPKHMSDNALQHLTGIQFFFATDVLAKKGHTLYLDSEWRLSSISQTSFWPHPRDRRHGYRGILSVDIGNVYEKHPKLGSFWDGTRDTIARCVWDQVWATIPEKERPYVPYPIAYHLDEYIVFGDRSASDAPQGGDKTPICNQAPYLVNRPGDWKNRPGDPHGYTLQCGRWALAGTYMQTFTRLTTMEAANESGRHAVNAILKGLQNTRRAWTPCETRDPELHELDDIGWLKCLDEKLFDYGRESGQEGGRLPHFMDIVELEASPEALLNVGEEGLRRLIFDRLPMWLSRWPR
jgi:NAD(P)-binding Rossmann-like domain